jgi:hypothetical protein
MIALLSFLVARSFAASDEVWLTSAHTITILRLLLLHRRLIDYLTSYDKHRTIRCA